MANLKPSTLRIGYRYRPKRLAPEYDAIVIGSGMGGLTTAALLSELGWKVCVLEQHYTAGGYTHSYDRAGYEWDVGVHYIGDVGAKTRTRRMFDFLSDRLAAHGYPGDRDSIWSVVQHDVKLNSQGLDAWLHWLERKK